MRLPAMREPSTVLLAAAVSWLVLWLALPVRTLGACTSTDFCCSGGASDGDPCALDSDCPGGACVSPQTVCDGGARNGFRFCESDLDCPGGACRTTQRVCGVGADRGSPCVRSDHCAGNAPCIANGFFCFGGDFDRSPCVTDEDCTPDGGAPGGTCRQPAAPLPETFLCSAGARDGLPCASDADCSSGVCVLAQGVCDGGRVDGLPCSAETDCEPGIPCIPTQNICVGGQNKGTGCLRTRHCPASRCAATGRACAPGSQFAGLSCADDADCGTRGLCRAATPSTPATPRRPTPVPTPTRSRVSGAPPTNTPLAETTLANRLEPADTEIRLTSTAGFPPAGTIEIEGEQITYSGIQGHLLVGVRRGQNDTVPARHLAGAAVRLVQQETSQTSGNCGIPGVTCVKDSSACTVGGHHSSRAFAWILLGLLVLRALRLSNGRGRCENSF